MNNVWITSEAKRSKTVSMSLCNHDDFYIPVSRLKTLENEPLYAFSKAWSQLTDHSITIVQNFAEFNAKLKEYLLGKLSYTVNCTKAFCPSCNHFLNA